MELWVSPVRFERLCVCWDNPRVMMEGHMGLQASSVIAVSVVVGLVWPFLRSPPRVWCFICLLFHLFLKENLSYLVFSFSFLLFIFIYFVLFLLSSLSFILLPSWASSILFSSLSFVLSVLSSLLWYETGWRQRWGKNVSVAMAIYVVADGDGTE